MRKGIILLVIFNLLYIVPFTLFYLAKANYEFLVYIAVLVAIALLVLFTLKKSKFDYLVLWGLSIWGLLHMLGGGIRVGESVLYRYKLIEIINRGGDFYILKMDQVIHFYGFLVAAILVFQLLAPYFKVHEKPKTAIFMAWVGSMGLGALNEVVEFLAFINLAKTGVGDVYNTGFDLIFNMFGALVGAFIAYNWYNYKLKNKLR